MALEILSRYPEARTIAAVVDYHGLLNDAEINKGVWLGENGAVKSPDEIFGSLLQTLRLFESQFGRAVELVTQFIEHVEVLGAESVKRHEELKSLNEAIQARRADLAAVGGSPQKEEKEG